MSNPVTPTDSQLMQIVGKDPYLLIAIRDLFEQAGTLSPDDIEAALLAGGNARTAANQALASIEALRDAIELVALMPQREQIKPDDDLSPRFEHVQQDTLVDLAPV